MHHSLFVKKKQLLYIVKLFIEEADYVGKEEYPNYIAAALLKKIAKYS